jgi:hypothetical protein
MTVLLAVAGGQALAATGVVGSKHDLTAATGPAGGQNTAATDQVCVFCHTPHGASNQTGVAVPLWNKVLGTPGSYTQYSTLQLPSFDAAEAPVGSVSLACLSCHDGTQAVDVVLNLPGSGGYSTTGNPIDGTLTTMPPVGGPIPNLTTDLTDDHPISIQYAAGGPTAADPDGEYTGPLGDTDFNNPWKATVNANPIWWVDSAEGIAGSREKTDMILYARADLGVVQPFVECGSCHDPHNGASGTAPDQVEVLRVSNTASQICTSCHIK